VEIHSPPSGWRAGRTAQASRPVRLLRPLLARRRLLLLLLLLLWRLWLLPVRRLLLLLLLVLVLVLVRPLLSLRRRARSRVLSASSLPVVLEKARLPALLGPDY
jgi:hypothetical protein